MKYYLYTIQHNKEKDAENRTAPTPYDDRKEAAADFFEQVGKDMHNSTLDGSMNMLVNSAAGVEGKKTWGVYGESEVLP